MASTLACPMFIPSRAFGANERVITGHIGLGGQGRGNLGQFVSNAVAVCDVDKNNAAKAAKTIADKEGRRCDVYGDYRKLLERKDIDAVVISTPDHWHALTTIHACEAGKDVYCEKPLTLTVAEGRKMVEAARKHKRVVQTGSQQRSSKEFPQACELVRNGHIGKVHTVLVGLPKSNHPGEPVPDSDPPAELDYDMWLGPAPYRPYNSKRVHYNFRFFWDYSGGQMTNWGAHHIDIAQWGLGMDDSGPVEIEGTATLPSAEVARSERDLPRHVHVCQRREDDRPRQARLQRQRHPRRHDVHRRQGPDLGQPRQDRGQRSRTAQARPLLDGDEALQEPRPSQGFPRLHRLAQQSDLRCRDRPSHRVASAIWPTPRPASARS